MDNKRSLSLEQRKKLIALGKVKKNEVLIERQDRGVGETLFPTSSSQRRLWFMYQMKPESIEYNVPVAYVIHGAFKRELCQAALDEVVARHEVLRTTFCEVDGEPMQAVASEKKADVMWVEEYVGLQGEEKEKAIDGFLKKETNTPFDLEHGPLFRTIVVKAEEDRHFLAFVAHHSIIDSWSIDILKKEFAQCYRKQVGDTSDELPELPIQYGDYAVWQQRELIKETDAEKVRYWVDKLKDATPELDLPADFERPKTRSGNGFNHRFSLSGKESELVKKAAAEHGCTVFMYLLAVYQVLLYHYTQLDRITVGTTITNRPTKETEHLIGFFINNITFNTPIEDGIRFADYLQCVKEETLQMYKHQDVPFEAIVEKLHLKRDLSRTALFQVMFNYLSEAGDVDCLEGIESEEYALGGSKATTDLNLFSWDNHGELTFNFEYATDLFKASTIERFARHFHNLVNVFTENPDMLIDAAEYIGDEEKYALLEEEFRQMEPSDPSRNAICLFEEQVEKTPDSVAMQFEGKKMTYEELNRKANQIAHYLISIGVKVGDTVGLYMDRSMEMVIGMLATMKAGGAYVPLDPTYPSERIEKIVTQAKIKQVLTQRFLLGEAPNKEGVELNCIDTILQNRVEAQEVNPSLELTGEELMYILFTSGSTGEPKGVMIRHKNYASYFKAVMKEVKIEEPLQYIIVTTFAADLGSFCIYAPLLTGGCVHIVAYEKATDAEWLADYFERNPIDVMKMVPSHFEALQISERANKIIAREMIIFAGEAVNKETIKKVWEHNPNCRVLNKYGPSETTVTATAYEITRKTIDELPEIPLGKPLSNTYGYVLNKRMKPVPYGVVGELYLGGDGVAAGYLGRDDLTAERFLEDPFHPESGRRIYKTGDLVRRMDNGDLVFLGRADRQVKIRGYRIELGAIEKVLREVNEVEEAVLNIRKEGQNQFLCAYVTLKAGVEGVTGSTIRKSIKSKIPDYWMPSFFVILDAIPLTANGKIDYKALPIPSVEGQLEESYVAPRDALEEELAAIWAEALGISKIGIDDNFFDLGGESFKAMRMTRKIGRGISVIDLFKFPTIRELHERLSGQTETETGRLVRLTPKPEGKVRMNYICFPFAGGSAIAFQPLANEMPKNCQLFGVRMPGHDYAMKDDVGGTIDELVAECVAEVKEKCEGPVSIYAQCVAGAVGVALAYALEAEGIEVTTVFEAANFPSPRLPGKLAELWAKIAPSDIWMSNRVYRETLKSLGNSDETNNEEEEKFIIAGIRHDARMSEDYFSSNYYKKDFPKLKAPICCIIGARDRTTEYYEERYREWEHYSDDVTYQVIEDAGHFFHKHQPKEVCGILAEQMLRQKNLEMQAIDNEETAVSLAEQAKTSKNAFGLKLFFLIMIGQVVSILGSNLSSFAIGIWLYGDTGSIGNFSMVSVATLVPSILLAPLAGMIADRYDKRKIMIMGDLFAIIGTLMVFLLYTFGELRVWHVCVSVVITAIGGAFQRPAFLSAIPIIVPKFYLGQANGIMQFASSGGAMLGPILGAALLYAIGMKGVLLMDFITCFISVGTLLLVRFPNRAFKKREEPFKKELIGGWNYIMKRRSMVTMVVYFIVANFLMSLVTVVFSPLAIGVSAESQVGIVLSANAAGVVAGSLIMSLWGGTKRRADGMVGFLILTSVSMIFMGCRPSALVVGIGLFFFGMSIAYVDTHWQIMIQSKVGLELQGRVFSINEMLVSIFRPFAFLLAPVLCDKIFTPFMQKDTKMTDFICKIIGNDASRGIGLYIIVIGVILLIWAVAGMRYRPLRYMEDYLPDAIPGAVIYEDKDKMQEELDRFIDKRAS